MEAYSNLDLIVVECAIKRLSGDEKENVKGQDPKTWYLVKIYNPHVGEDKVFNRVRFPDLL